ncbi:MAG: hypothetical protein ABJA71_10805, partial [Ginsengibacter sp.]
MHSSDTENISFPKRALLNEDELTVMAEEYPYYSIAQFRLLSDYKKNKNKNFEKQALLTALFFNNTRWLNGQLCYHAKSEDKYNESVEINSTAAASEQSDFSIHEIVPEQFEETRGKNLLINKSSNDVLNAFEPLHTVDYFASQGIKISDESISNDKLSTQLKSFTEWLKSMKKIHVHLPEADEQTDKIIQNIAES